MQKVIQDDAVRDVVLSCGISKYIGHITVKDSAEIVKHICLRQVLLGPKSAIDQFIEGLDEVRFN